MSRSLIFSNNQSIMKKTTEVFCVWLVVSIFICTADASCCFGYRKVCETISDVTELHGEEEWQSLVIAPNRCENITRPQEKETIKPETFNKVPNLTNLYIVDTLVRFEEKSFQPLRDNLIYLSIIKNNISTISSGVFQDLPKLKKLVLRDSSIDTIANNAFYNLTKLEILLLSGNLLREVKVGLLNTLDIKSVDLSFNRITSIEKNAFPNNLYMLNLKKNQLLTLEDGTFANLKSLEMLILSKNKLKAIRKGAFTGLSNLSKLDLSRNEIDTIEEDTFTGLHELMFLYLKENRLQTLNANVFLKDMINLTDLELEQNKLTFLSDKLFRRLPNLEEISIGDNPWQCKCLENIRSIMNNKLISLSDTDDRIPKCRPSSNSECLENA